MIVSCVFSLLIGCASVKHKSPTEVYLSGTGLIASSNYESTTGKQYEGLCLIREPDQSSDDRYLIDPSSVNQVFGECNPPLCTYDFAIKCSYQARLIPGTMDPQVVQLLQIPAITNIYVMLDKEPTDLNCVDNRAYLVEPSQLIDVLKLVYDKKP